MNRFSNFPFANFSYEEEKKSKEREDREKEGKAGLLFCSLIVDTNLNYLLYLADTLQR